MTSGQAQTYSQTSSPKINPDRGYWDWMSSDAFDNFAEEFNGIQPWNCRLRRGYYMDINTVSQRIQFNTMLQVLLLKIFITTMRQILNFLMHF